MKYNKISLTYIFAMLQNQEAYKKHVHLHSCMLKGSVSAEDYRCEVNNCLRKRFKNDRSK